MICMQIMTDDSCAVQWPSVTPIVAISEPLGR